MVTIAGIRRKKIQVPDVEKYEAFARTKKAEASRLQTETREDVEKFKEEQERIAREKEAERKRKLASIDRIKKVQTRLTQDRTDPRLGLFKRDVAQVRYERDVAVSKKTRKEYDELNEDIERINQELASYKPTKEVVVSYADVEGGDGFIVSDEFATEFINTKIEPVQQDTTIPYSPVAPGFKVVDGQVVPEYQIGGFEPEKEYVGPVASGYTIFENKVVREGEPERIKEARVRVGAAVVNQFDINIDKDIVKDVRVSDFPDAPKKPFYIQEYEAPRFGGASLPEGEKVKFYTAAELFQKGLLGSAVTTAKEDFKPYTISGRTDESKAVVYAGLSFIEPATSIGQTAGLYIFDKPEADFQVQTSQGFRVEQVKGRQRLGEDFAKFQEAFGRDPVGLIGAGVTEVQKTAIRDPIGFGASTAGSILLFEGVGMGASALVKGARIGFGKVTAIGKTRIPFEQLVPDEVLIGAKTFPEFRGTAKELLAESRVYAKNFAIGGKQRLYSATDYFFTPFRRTIKIGPGRGLEKGLDVPGQYFSFRGVSEYFLRLTKNKPKTSYSFFPNLKSLRRGSPKIFAGDFTGAVIPDEYLTSFAKSQEFFGKFYEGGKAVLKQPAGKKGTVYITPAFESQTRFAGIPYKLEAEGVLQVNQSITRSGLKTAWEKLTGYKYYTVARESGGFWNRNIPIYEVVSTTGRPTGVLGKVATQTVSGSSLARSVVSSTPIGSYALAGAFVSSYKPPTQSNFSNYIPSQVSQSSFALPSRQPTYSFNYQGTPSYTTPSYAPEYSVPTYTAPSYSPQRLGYVQYSVPSYDEPIPSYTRTPPTTPPRTTIPKRQPELYSTDSKPTGTFHAYSRRDKNSKWVKET